MKIVKDKIAIVTGGASGLGRALSEQLGERGAVVIVADINTAGATRVSEGVVASGGKAKASRLDVYLSRGNPETDRSDCHGTRPARLYVQHREYRHPGRGS